MPFTLLQLANIQTDGFILKYIFAFCGANIFIEKKKTWIH
jgi:hypothetical protein